MSKRLTEPIDYDEHFDVRFWQCIHFCRDYPFVVDVIMKSLREGHKINCRRPGKCKDFPCACLACDLTKDDK